MLMSTLSRTIFRRAAAPAVSAPARSGASSLRYYGSTDGKGSTKSHGGQSPTERNMGETGSAGPSSDMVADSSAAFDSNPDPASSTKQVEKDLPSGESMQNSAANPGQSKQFGKEETDNQASGMNTSQDSQGGRRSSRGPGTEV